jgi:toxin ParE1/3/4
MSGWKLSRRARKDLAEVWQYSNRQWGPEQADRYIAGLQEACGKLAANPSLGRPIPEVPKEIRQYRYGSHVIVHQMDGEQVYVARILHEGMDHLRHLRKK